MDVKHLAAAGSLAGLAIAAVAAYAWRTRGFAAVATELRTPLSYLRSPSIGPMLLPMLQYGSRRATRPVAGVTVDMIAIPRVDATALTVHVYRPVSVMPGGAAMLHTHGGGMILGSPPAYHRRVSALARDLGIVIVSADYRLAPRDPFPAPLDDIYSAYRWLADAVNPLGIDASRIIVGGDSAGGGLTAALCQRLRDVGGPPPILQWLVYPMLDDRSALSPADHRGQIVWTRASNAFSWAAYLGHPPGADSVARYAVPARAADLSGLPSAWIGVGTLDLFHDEDVAYANRLRAADVACELTVVDGAFHGFDILYPDTGIAASFRATALAAIRRAIAAPPADTL